jgi:class 3 adenylate cyclase
MTPGIADAVASAGMQVKPEMPAVDRWTLRFADDDIETAYRQAAVVSDRQMQTGLVVSIGLWLVGGVLAAAATSAPDAPIYAVSVGMGAANAIGATLVSRSNTFERQQLVGATLNVLAGIAVLGLGALTDTFDLYGAPALMLVAVFAFLVLRLRFVLAAFAATVYVVGYVAFAIATRSATSALDLFLVTAAVAVACGATYALEAGQRREFAQSRTIAALHRQVDRLFRQYLSRDIATTLLAGGHDTMGGEVVEVTILFADLEGFTPYSERSDPREIVALLNAYFEVAVPAIYNEGGTVLQFAGDAIMAVFNAPTRQPDHALRAARSALALQAAVEAVPIAGARPRFRVGLNTGEVLVGNIGSEEMRNFTVIGDATNVAARLQTFAQAGQVVMGPQTYEELGSCARVVPLGTPALKGKSDPVEVYQLIGLCSSEDGVRVGSADQTADANAS